MLLPLVTSTRADRSATGLPLAATALLAVAVLTAPLASVSHATLSTEEAGCVLKLATDAAKVAGAQRKLQGSCVKAKAKGTIVGTVDACVEPVDPFPLTAAKLEKSLDKTLTDETASCAGYAGFLPVSGYTTNLAARFQSEELILDLFGSNLDAAVSTDSAVAKCQGKVLKALGKVASAKIKSYNSCLKTAVLTANDLTPFVACLNGVQGNAKVITAIAKLALARAGSCGTLTLGTVFPGACAAEPTPTAFDDCADAVAECQTCHLIGAMHDLSIDCDLFDNSSIDGSCDSNPPTCGDGTENLGEECDDGNNVGGDCCSAICGPLVGTGPELCYTAGDEDCDGLADSADPGVDSVCATNGTELCACSEACQIGAVLPIIGSSVSLNGLVSWSSTLAGSVATTSNLGDIGHIAGLTYTYAFTSVPPNLSLWWGLSDNAASNAWNGSAGATAPRFRAYKVGALNLGNQMDGSGSASYGGLSMTYSRTEGISCFPGVCFGDTNTQLVFTADGASGNWAQFSTLINMSALSPGSLQTSANSFLGSTGAIALPPSPTSFDVIFQLRNAGTGIDALFDSTSTISGDAYGANFTGNLYGTYRNANVCP